MQAQWQSSVNKWIKKETSSQEGTGKTGRILKLSCLNSNIET